MGRIQPRAGACSWEERYWAAPRPPRRERQSPLGQRWERPRTPAVHVSASVLLISPVGPASRCPQVHLAARALCQTLTLTLNVLPAKQPIKLLLITQWTCPWQKDQLHTSFWSQFPWRPPAPLCIPAMLFSLLGLEQAMPATTPGPLHSLFLLFRQPFPRISSGLAPPLPVGLRSSLSS